MLTQLVNHCSFHAVYRSNSSPGQRFLFLYSVLNRLAWATGSLLRRIPEGRTMGSSAACKTRSGVDLCQQIKDQGWTRARSLSSAIRLRDESRCLTEYGSVEAIRRQNFVQGKANPPVVLTLTRTDTVNIRSNRLDLQLINRHNPSVSFLEPSAHLGGDVVGKR